MTDQDKGDTLSQPAKGERKRRQRKGLPKPVVRLLLLIAALIVIIVVIVVAARAVTSNAEAA
ncbi:MAG: hypothetical protein H5T84_00900, partial [Thermoleophilia bacterium]|nr:hypothetical protein [Thermoleophilia bacterium]